MLLLLHLLDRFSESCILTLICKEMTFLIYIPISDPISCKYLQNGQIKFYGISPIPHYPRTYPVPNPACPQPDTWAKLGLQIRGSVKWVDDGSVRATTTPNFEDCPYPCDTLKFRFIFVKRGDKGVIMITWSHFLLLVSWKKGKLKNSLGLK